MLLPEHVLGLHMGPQYRKKLLRTSTSSSSITDSLKYVTEQNSNCLEIIEMF